MIRMKVFLTGILVSLISSESDASDQILLTPGALNQSHEFPYISCPLIFQYVKDTDFGGWFGLISLPKPTIPHEDIVLEVNMTYNRPISFLDHLKLMLISTADEVRLAEFLKWAVIFPFQNVYPKLMSMKLNNVQMCTNYPDPVTTGSKQSYVWARSTIRKRVKGSNENRGKIKNLFGKYPGEDNQFFSKKLEFVPNSHSMPGVSVSPQKIISVLRERGVKKYGKNENLGEEGVRYAKEIVESTINGNRIEEDN